MQDRPCSSHWTKADARWDALLTRLRSVSPPRSMPTPAGTRKLATSGGVVPGHETKSRSERDKKIPLP